MKTLLILFSVFSSWAAVAQWNTSGNNISNANSGNVGIGTAQPDEKLTVKGIIHSQEVKVDLNVPGPDYVFDEGYELMTLRELAAYLDKHKHLPQVPAAVEMEANGIQLGEMNMILLKKIEELTLYLIQLETKTLELEARLESLDK